MKPSDIVWIQNTAAQALGKATQKGLPLHSIAKNMNMFLDELCTLMNEYCSYFNELILEDLPGANCNVFRIGSPRPGLMLLRGRDKLVISSEGSRIRCRVVQVHAYNEKCINAMDFEGFVTKDDEVHWFCMNDNQRVNPELVAKNYLGRFLAFGCCAFEMNQGLKTGLVQTAESSSIP
jgi:hypothetical protein